MSTVTVKVTVMAAPACIINNNKPIEVEFGDVLTTRVDGSNYRRPIEYDLTCDGGASNAMKLQVRGTGAGFDATVLGVSEQPALGIELQKDSGKLALNDWLNFTYPNKPKLYAVPVVQVGTTLGTGTFSAAATMAVDYQ